MRLLQRFSALNLFKLMFRSEGVRKEVWAPGGALLSDRNRKNDLPTDKAGSCQRKPGCELSQPLSTVYFPLGNHLLTWGQDTQTFV